jgi:hypothetical protein
VRIWASLIRHRPTFHQSIELSMLSAAVLVLCALAALVRADSVPTLTFQVEPKKTICLYENLTPGQVTASWEVVRGGLLDINIAVSHYQRGKQ